MKDDFMYVLENYTNADLSNTEDREKISQALVNIMCEHHIVTYTDLNAVEGDAKMKNWINHCKTLKTDKNENITERGL